LSSPCVISLQALSPVADTFPARDDEGAYNPPLRFWEGQFFGCMDAIKCRLRHSTIGRAKPQAAVNYGTWAVAGMRSRLLIGSGYDGLNVGLS
jgi:hypothetical protein